MGLLIGRHDSFAAGPIVLAAKPVDRFSERRENSAQEDPGEFWGAACPPGTDVLRSGALAHGLSTNAQNRYALLHCFANGSKVLIPVIASALAVVMLQLHSPAIKGRTNPVPSSRYLDRVLFPWTSVILAIPGANPGAPLPSRLIGVGFIQSGHAVQSRHAVHSMRT